MRPILIGVSAALVLVAGSVAAVALFTAPTLAVAQSDDAIEAEEHPRLERAREWLRDATAHLVPDVISEDQQAAVVDAIVDAGAQGVREKVDHFRNRARRVLGAAFEVSAEAIGVETDVLVTQVRDEGKTIADVAREQGVEPQAVIDALVKAGTDVIDERVAAADRDVDPERIAKFKERLPEIAERFVNGTWPDREKVGGFFHRFARGEDAEATN